MNAINTAASQGWGMPLVSVCIPTYNAALTIQETLASILGQTYLNLVVHVSDNASTDETLNIVESFKDPRVTIHRHEFNIGGEGNFNRCIQFAEGEYSAIFHADDVYEPNMVATQIRCLEENTQVATVFTEAKTIDANGVVTGLVGKSFNGDNNLDLYDFVTLFKSILKRGNFVVCPSAMFRTDVLKNEIQRWRGDLFKSSADLDVWLRVSSKHYVAFLKQPLMKYRVDNKQFSNQVRLRTTRADFFLVLDYYLELPKVKLMLTDADFKNYLQLIYNDKFWRALNLFMMGNVSHSKQLMRDALSFDIVKEGIKSRRVFFTLVASLILRFMIWLNINNVGTRVIKMLRNKVRK